MKATVTTTIITTFETDNIWDEEGPELNHDVKIDVSGPVGETLGKAVALNGAQAVLDTLKADPLMEGVFVDGIASTDDVLGPEASR